MHNIDASDPLSGHDDNLRDADASFSVRLCLWYHEHVRHSSLSVLTGTHHLSMIQKAHPTISVKERSPKYVGTKPHSTGLRSPWIPHMSSVKCHRRAIMIRPSARTSIRATSRRDMSTKKDPESPFEDRISQSDAQVAWLVTICRQFVLVGACCIRMLYRPGTTDWHAV